MSGDPSFWATFGQSSAQSLGNAAVNTAASSILGGPSLAKQKRDAREGYKTHMKYGVKPLDEYNWSKAKERGLTPQEYYGSAAPGQSASSGLAQTMGNNAGQAGLQKQEIAADSANRERDRQTTLGVAQIQAQTQKEVAQIGAGATIESTKLSTAAQERIANNRLKFDSQVYRETVLPQAAATLKLTEQQTLKVINEVATSTPEFVRLMKLLGMGPDNMLASAVALGLPVDITDPEQAKKISEEQKAKIISEILSVQGRTAKEIESVMAFVKRFLPPVKDSEESRKRDRDNPDFVGPHQRPTEKVVDWPFIKIYRDN